MEALQALKRRIARAGQRGVTTVEYAVMLVLVAVAVLAFGAYLGDSVKDTFSRVVVWLGDGSSGSGGSGGSASAPLGNQGRGGGNGNGNGNGRGNGNGNGDVNGNGGGVGN
jgi:Flp pilus assembly pilin Flp